MSVKTTLHPVLFDSGIITGLTGGPDFSDTTTEDEIGARHTNSNWESALWEWNISSVASNFAFEKLLGFWLARRGTAFGFYFYDPRDYNNNSGITFGGTSATIGRVATFPDGKRYLCKEYPDTGNYSPYRRIIRCVTAGTLSYSGVSGTPVLNPLTGEITGATSDGLASFEFVNPVTFTNSKYRTQSTPAIETLTDVTMRELRSFQIAS